MEQILDYGHVIIPGSEYVKGNFLERTSHSDVKQTYKISRKLSYFYKESVLYPFVNFKEDKKGLVLYNQDLTDIHYIEINGFSHLYIM